MTARPDTIRYRTAKFIQRHRTGAVAALHKQITPPGFAGIRAKRNLDGARKKNESIFTDILHELRNSASDLYLKQRMGQGKRMDASGAAGRGARIGGRASAGGAADRN